MAKIKIAVEAERKPKFAVRKRNRCKKCGRPRGFLRKFQLCRVCFRELALGSSDAAAASGGRPEILFPTETGTVGRKKIDRAVERVAARKK